MPKNQDDDDYYIDMNTTSVKVELTIRSDEKKRESKIKTNKLRMRL